MRLRQFRRLNRGRPIGIRIAFQHGGKMSAGSRVSSARKPTVPLAALVSRAPARHSEPLGRYSMHNPKKIVPVVVALLLAAPLAVSVLDAQVMETSAPPAPTNAALDRKDHAEVVAALSERLKEELAAIGQYMVHAEMSEGWGYQRLAEHTEKRAIVEMKHAEKLIQRILFLEGMPKVDEMAKVHIGTDVKQQLSYDLEAEEQAIAAYNETIELCRRVGDNATANLLDQILMDEDGHFDFLQQQLDLIEQLGLPYYLAEQLQEEE
jgi:bacterioferritin